MRRGPACDEVMRTLLLAHTPAWWSDHFCDTLVTRSAGTHRPTPELVNRSDLCRVGGKRLNDITAIRSGLPELNDGADGIVRAKPATEQAVAAIMDLLTSGELGPGDRLPTERD